MINNIAVGTCLQIPLTFFNSIATDAAITADIIEGATDDSRTVEKS